MAAAFYLLENYHSEGVIMHLIILAGLFYVLQNTSNNLFSHRFRRGLYQLCMLNSIALIIGSAALLILSRPGGIPMAQMAYAAAYGTLFLVTLSMISVTLSMGPLNMSALIINMCAVISILFGALVFHEKITPACAAAFALMGISLVMISLPEHREPLRARRGWLPMALVTMVFNGLLSVIPKAAFLRHPDLGATDFTFWSLMSGAIICTLLLAILRLFAGQRLGQGETVQKMVPLSAGIGIGTAGGLYFQNAALMILPSIVVSPVVIGLNVSLLMVVSVTLFKEHLSLRKGIAFLIGIAGILLTNF